MLLPTSRFQFLSRCGVLVAAFAVVSVFLSSGHIAGSETLRPAAAAPQCDCAACGALLTGLGIGFPSEWLGGGAAACDCALCGTATRLLLRQLSLGSDSTLPADAAALGPELSSAEGLQRLSAALARLARGGGAAAPAAPPAPVAAAAASTASAAGTAGSAATAPAAASTPSPAAPRFAGANGEGGRPAWPVARSVRGWPAPACGAASAFGASALTCAAQPLALPTRCIVGTHRAHWDFFTTAVQGSQEPFALLRYVDGERMILQGTQVPSSSQAGSEDKWWYEGGQTQLARDMEAGLRGHHGEPYFFAFASPQDDDEGLRWYMDRTEATCEQITYANLWINGFYTATKPFLLNLLASQAQRIVLVANHEGVDKFAPCVGAGTSSGLMGCISLPDQAVYTWEDPAKKQVILDSMLGWAAKAPPGSLFIMCGGPLSKPLIAAAWSAYPVHQYVDFGSSLDEVLKGRKTRPCECVCAGGGSCM